jgi:hypothetical protein
MWELHLQSSNATHFANLRHQGPSDAKKYIENIIFFHKYMTHVSWYTQAWTTADLFLVTLDVNVEMVPSNSRRKLQICSVILT